MNYIDTGTLNYPISEREIALLPEFSNVTFPSPFEPPTPFAAVTPAERPTIDPWTQRVVELAPDNVNGTWTQRWEIVNFTELEMSERIASAVAGRWEEIKAMRDQRKVEGGYKVAVGGVDKWFHSDIFSRTQQIGLTMMGANVPPVPWKTMDGTFVTMSQALAGQIFMAAAASDMNLFAFAEALIAQVNASDRPHEYDITAGWPPVFGE